MHECQEILYPLNIFSIKNIHIVYLMLRVAADVCECVYAASMAVRPLIFLSHTHSEVRLHRKFLFNDHIRSKKK